MADSPVQTAIADVKADVAKVEAAAKSDVSKVEADVKSDVATVKSTWLTKVRPWITHALAVVAGYFAAEPSVLAAFVAKLL